jgi:hypothetical protein
MAFITALIPGPGNLSACHRESQSPGARPRLRAGEPDRQGCSVRENTEGGYLPMITSVHSLSVMQPPR